MQRALLGIRQSQPGRPILFIPSWPQRLAYCNQALSVGLKLRRHISFPGFIPHVPSEQHVRTAVEEVTLHRRSRGAHDDEEFSFSEGLRQGITKALSRPHHLPKADLPRPGSALYGKWHSLSLDEERMLQELDINTSGGTIVKEVDQIGNEHDIELWSCLLEFANRRMGRDGVVMVWQSVSKRRNLYQVDGPLAQNFWAVILSAAVSDTNLLRDVVRYADWLYQNHHVRWPRLYSTVVAYMLGKLMESDKQQVKEWKSAVIKWHFETASSSGPSENEFVDLIKQFIVRPGRTLRGTLQLLYTYSPHRNLYDVLIPYLYDNGHSRIAMEWRAFLVSFNDLPMSTAGRPFLRFFRGYYPQNRLTKDELSLADMALNVKAGEKSQLSETAIAGQNLSYIINRVHGETFGITEKPYNDRLGAKWFASTWVSVDFAINVIHTMGIQMIGPLSLQSISLREGSAAGALRRIDQLQQLRIRLPRSNYVEAIRHYAATGDDEALQELLQSDMHPEIFDDEEAQQKLLANCPVVGDWSTYRLILNTRLAIISSSRVTAINDLLASYIRRSNGPMALKILKEMSSHRLEIFPATSHILSGFILDNLSPHASKASLGAFKTQQYVDLQVSLCHQLAATRFPPAVDVWQTLLYRLGREKRLSDLERLSLYIVRLYKDHTTSEKPMWISHIADLPRILRSESPFQNFQKLPRDLPISHPQHPLSQIFDSNLLNAIVRWGFIYTPLHREAEGAAAEMLRSLESGAGNARLHWPPNAFHLARGIWLLAMLRDEGISVPAPLARKHAQLRLVDLYRGGGKSTYKWVSGNPMLRLRRRQLRFTLAEAKKLCDEAWGNGEVVSSLLDLERDIERAEQIDRVEALQKKMEDMKNPQLARRRGGVN